MAIKGDYHQNELFFLCPAEQQIFFSTYYTCSPIISTVGDMREKIDSVFILQKCIIQLGK